MVILGFSGFESLGGATARPPAQGRRARRDGDSAGFDRISPQLFPLNLIGHDPAAALLVDGALVASAAEERFSRIKHGFNLAGRTVLPRQAMRFCLDHAGLDWGDVDCWAHYCRFTPQSVANRLIRVSARLRKEDRSLLRREYAHSYRNRLSRDVLRRQLEALTGRHISDAALVRVQHHVAHLAGGYFSSGFPEALCLSLDGYGEEESSMWGLGRDAQIQPEGVVLLPTSLGMVYQLVTAHLGFAAFGDEYKVMGLAAYGHPEAFASAFAEIIQLLPGGAYSTDRICRSDLKAWLSELLGEVPPASHGRRSADIAASLQRALESTVLHQLAFLRAEYGLERLCISGGVGLNACANGAIIRSGMFRDVFIQPAAADDGAGLGAALFALHRDGDGDRADGIRHVYWGPAFEADEIETALRSQPDLRWERADDAISDAARLLSEQKILGWFQDRMEIGPRALGARSILASPASTPVRDRLNELIKKREMFRPFAPSVLQERARDYFELEDDSAAPFMIATYPVRPEMRGRIPGVVHVDGTARVQTVKDSDNPRFHELLVRFEELAGIPVLLNTSFNRAGEPIVAGPSDAIACFKASGLDALVLGDYLVYSTGG